MAQNRKLRFAVAASVVLATDGCGVAYDSTNDCECEAGFVCVDGCWEKSQICAAAQSCNEGLCQ